MIREFALIDLGYLVLAARWTLLLSAIAFLGGGLVGLLVTLLRVSPLPPLRWVAGTWILAIAGSVKAATNVTITTPPLAGKRFRMLSGTLRGTSQTARAEE